MSSALEKIVVVAISLIATAFFINISNQPGWESYLGLGSILLWLVITILLGQTFELSFLGAGIFSFIIILFIIGLFSFSLLLMIILWVSIGALLILIIAYAISSRSYGY